MKEFFKTMREFLPQEDKLFLYIVDYKDSMYTRPKFNCEEASVKKNTS